MFFRMLFGFWTLMHLYVFWRAGTVPGITRRMPRMFLFVAGFLLWAGFIPARFLSHDDPGMISRLFEIYMMHWIAVIFLVFVALLAVDIVTGFGFLISRSARKMRGWAIAAGMGLSLFALFLGLRPPVVSHYQVTLPSLPAEMDGTKLVALSDLHLGTLIGTRWLEARTSQVQALEPDVIVLLGDLLEGHGDLSEEEIIPVLAKLDAPLGVWAVTGNHESHGNYDGRNNLLGQAGVTVLHDRWAELRPGFTLAGVDDLTRRLRQDPEGNFIGKALEGRPPGAAVLLSHSPLETGKAALGGAGLMISGHTHGGQIWPFGYLVRLRYPLLAGRYESDGLPVIISRGTGTWGPRMRLWQPGEILSITLRAP